MDPAVSPALTPVPLGEKLRFGLLAAGLIGTYEIVRPTVEAWFVGSLGAAAVPYAWFAVLPGALAAADGYARLAARHGPSRAFGLALLASALLLGGLLSCARFGPEAPALFCLYVFKDIYVVVVVEAFWARANGRFAADEARRVYGIFTASGSLGGAVAGLWVGPLGGRLGTSGLLAAVVPLLLALGLPSALGRSVPIGPKHDEKQSGLRQGFRVLHASPVLAALLSVVALSQVVITLVDWLFLHAASEAFSTDEARAGAIGQVYAAINALSVVLQLGTGAVLGAVGVGGALVGVPAVGLLAIAGALIGPGFGFVAAAKVASKVLDYSLFRATKEILYIGRPLLERTAGKAVIDVVGYRGAKAAAAALVAVLSALLPPAGVGVAAGAIAVLWVVSSVLLHRRALTPARGE